MGNEIKYIGNNKITIIDEPFNSLIDDLPEEIDFSKLKRVENPLISKPLTVTLEPDVAKHFKSAKQLNQFLRLQIKSLEKINR